MLDRQDDRRRRGPCRNIGSTRDVAVANLADDRRPLGPSSANEGETKTYTYRVSDPGRTRATVTESCGLNGTSSHEPPAADNSFQCTFPDGPECSTVKVTADDGDPVPQQRLGPVTSTSPT